MKRIRHRLRRYRDKLRYISKEFSLLWRVQHKGICIYGVVATLIVYALTAACVLGLSTVALYLIDGRAAPHISTVAHRCITAAYIFFLTGCVLVGIPRTLLQFFSERIKELSPNYGAWIDHGGAITDVVHNLKFESVVFMAFFDSSGQKLYEVTSFGLDEILLRSDDMPEIPDCTIVYNHPNCNGAIEAEVIFAALGCGAKKIILVSYPMVYEMELPDSSICVDAAEVLEYSKRTYDTGPVLSFFSFKDADLCCDLTAAYSIACCRGIAERYGMKFTAVPYEKSIYAKT